MLSFERLVRRAFRGHRPIRLFCGNLICDLIYNTSVALRVIFRKNNSSFFRKLRRLELLSETLSQFSNRLNLDDRYDSNMKILAGSFRFVKQDRRERHNYCDCD